MEPPEKRARMERRCFQIRWELLFLLLPFLIFLPNWKVRHCVICAKEFKHKKECNFKKHFLAQSKNLKYLRDLQGENRQKKFNDFKAILKTRIGVSMDTSSNTGTVSDPVSKQWSHNPLQVIVFQYLLAYLFCFPYKYLTELLNAVVLFFVP